MLALSPMLVFMAVYLIGSLLAGDFYKVPLTVAFLTASTYAICITPRLRLKERISLFSRGAGDENLMLMVWIFILAGAFAESAGQMGAIDATVNLTLRLLPDSMLLPGLFLAACFISLSIGTSVGTVVALTPVAVGIAHGAQQVGNNAAVDKGIEDVHHLIHRIPQALEAVYRKEKQNTQADGTETCQHAIDISSL